ncbi:MAG: hypothetical protein ACLQOO_07965 [Terriglobia bacterium]
MTVAFENIEPDSGYVATRDKEISITRLQADRTDYATLGHLSGWLASLTAPAGRGR